MKKQMISLFLIVVTVFLSSCGVSSKSDTILPSSSLTVEDYASENIDANSPLREDDEAAQQIYERIALEDGSVYYIDSYIGKLQYPLKWKSYIRTESSDTAISFFATVESHNEELLFRLEFAKSDGSLLGFLGETPVYVVDATDPTDETWSEIECEEFYAMQEDLNIILQGLMEREDFVVAHK